MPNFLKDPLSFHIEAESASDFRAVEDDEPFRIALLGDFSGAGRRTAVSARRPILIDRDDFDDVLRGMRVTVDLPAGPLSIGNLDQFHPDHIYATYSAFDEIRETRAKLADPSTFAEAARDLLGEKPAPISIPSGGLLDLIAGETDTTAKEPGDLQDFIDKSMRSELAERQDPRAPQLIRQVDEIASDLMRAVLNNPNFKAIESAWRTVCQLVKRLETGTELKIYLVDITKRELASNIEDVYRMLIQKSEPWAVIAANYAFGIGDLRLLGRMGRIAMKAEVPFLAEADGSLFGEDSDWEEFRETEEAAHIGLALPRVLLRMPYGKQTIPCEALDFEEISGSPHAKQMLFGSPAYFAAMLLGESFTNDAWSLRPGSVREISDLPLYSYDDGGEGKVFPVAEIELTEDTAEALMDAGFMPLIGIRNSDVVRLGRFQSVANPPAALLGKWQ